MTISLVISVDQDSYAGYKLADTDVLCVSAGGRSLASLRATVAGCRREYPSCRVWASCGPRRVPEMVGLDVDTVCIDWEQSSVKADGRSWSWEMADTLGHISAVSLPVRQRYGLLITAAPLVNKRLARQKVVWDYPKFAEMGSKATILQTQGFLARSPLARLRDRLRGNTDYEIALDRLSRQYAFRGSELARLGVEVAMGSTANSVSPAVGAEAVKLAESYGIGLAFIFGQAIAENRRFIARMRG